MHDAKIDDDVEINIHLKIKRLKKKELDKILVILRDIRIQSAPRRRATYDLKMHFVGPPTEKVT